MLLLNIFRWELKHAAPVKTAGIYGGKQALKLTAYVPAAMAVCYLLLILYFKATGGYKVVHVGDEGKH